MSDLKKQSQSLLLISHLFFIVAFASSFSTPVLSQTTPTVVLHGGSYQLVPSTDQCLVANRFTAACSCPPTYNTTCFDVLIHANTTVDVSTTVTSNSTTAVNSKFCICDRTQGVFASTAVYGGAYQQDDPVPCGTTCRYKNPHTNNCTCPIGFRPIFLRSLAYGLNATCSNAMFGSHVIICVNASNAKAVGTIVNDATTFTTTAPVLNNFFGVYSITTNQSSLACLLDNVVPVRSSRYLKSINAALCNCPVSACGASFFWLTDALGYPFQYQRVVLCEGSMQLAVDPTTEKSKVMLGYQSWQSTPKNGFGTGWSHLDRFGDPQNYTLVDNAVFDVWPDTSEFPTSNLSSAALARPDGSITTLYDAYLDQTTQVHHQWLQYYGLDGVWLQSFLTVLADARFLAARNSALTSTMKYSVKYQRVFGVEWDMSGMTNDNIFQTLQTDITRLKQMGIFSSSAYISHGGKPLVTIYGFGIRPQVNVSTALSCINLLKSSGFVVMGGVDFSWRTRATGADGEDFFPVYNSFDILSPWAVGAYNNPQNYLDFGAPQQIGDVSYCTQHSILYTPVVFPGFSWYNLQLRKAPFNQIPRQGGFFWQTQVDSLQQTTIPQPSFSHLFLAMFDEIDEGTAMTKAAESYLDKPANGTFLSYDADGFHVPNDHYLCLASRQTYRQHQPLSISFPYKFKSS